MTDITERNADLGKELEGAAEPVAETVAEPAAQAEQKELGKDEKLIAKAQSKAQQHSRRTLEEAEQRSAVIGYGEEYRRRLMQEEAQRLEEERRERAEEERSELESARRERAEKREKMLEGELEELRARSSESDELLRAVKESMEISAAEQAPAEESGAASEPAPEKESEAEKEDLTLNIPETTVEKEDLVLNIPAQTVTVGFTAPAQGGFVPPVPGFVPPMYPHAAPPPAAYAASFAHLAEVAAKRAESERKLHELELERNRYISEINKREAQKLENERLNNEAKLLELQEETERYKAELERLGEERSALEAERTNLANEQQSLSVELESVKAQREAAQADAAAMTAGDSLCEQDELKAAAGSLADSRAIEEYERELARREAASVDSAKAKGKYADKRAMADEAAIAEYERALAKRGMLDDATLANEPLKAQPQPQKIEAQPQQKASEKDAALDAAGFALFCKSTVKRLREIDKTIRKLEKKEGKASETELKSIFNEKLALEKEGVDLLCQTLCSAVSLSDKKAIKKFKKLLSHRIASYNTLLKECKSRTGKDIPLISRSVPKDIIAGRAYQRTQNIYFAEGSHLPEQKKLSRRERKRLEREELKLAAKTEAEREELEKTVKKKLGKKALTKEQKEALQDKLSAIAKQREYDEQLIEARYDFLIARNTTERDAKSMSFFVKKKGKKKTHVELLNKRIKTLTAERGKAAKQQRLDNARYYEIVATDVSITAFKKRGANREELGALRRRIELLLAKRDEINKKLLNLYTGYSAQDGKRGLDTKVAKVKREAMKKVYKQQKRIYRLLESQKAPASLKEKVYELMNEKTAKTGTVAELTYRIKKGKLTGAAKREFVKERKKQLGNIKRIDADIKRYRRKKISKVIERNKTRKSQIAWLIALVIIIGGGYALYYFFGAQIVETVNGILGGLFGGGN